MRDCSENLQTLSCFPILEKIELFGLCMNSDIEAADDCGTVSKKLVQAYLQDHIEKIIMYIMQYSTSDSFIKVLNENFIDLRWNLIKFGHSTPKSKLQ